MSIDQPVRRSFIVHIGMPRAGSSTLQEVSFNYRQQLEQHGLLYPTQSDAVTGHTNKAQVYNHKLALRAANSIWPPGRFAALHQDLARQIAASNAPQVLLSCESWWSPGNFRALARSVAYVEKHCPELELRIVAVVREPVSFIMSYYKLDVLHGRTDELLDRYWRGKLSDPRLRYGDIARRLMDRFASVTMLDFDALSAGDRFVGSFLAAIGAGGVLAGAGLQALESHRNAGGDRFADAQVSLALFASRHLGLRSFRARRTAIIEIISRIASREDLASDLGRLRIRLGAEPTESIVAATRPQIEALQAATSLRLPDIRETHGAEAAQSLIADDSPLGVIMRDELKRLA